MTDKPTPGNAAGPEWKRGDRVVLAPSGYLPNGRPRGGLARGAVTAVDDCSIAGLTHVHVLFDESFNGMDTCTASPTELRREDFPWREMEGLSG